MPKKSVKKKYSKSRPRISSVLRREIKVESRHACLVCKERVSLQIHHIDGNRENNTNENLVYICANCHGMEQDGKISAADFKEYKRKAKEADEEMLRLQERISYIVGSPKITISSNFQELKIKYHAMINEYTEKLIFYQCFIYLIPEFYIDKRGNEVRETVRKLLEISIEEERAILDHLVQMNIVDITGDLITLKDNKDAKTALNELIESNKVDISKIIEAFI